MIMAHGRQREDGVHRLDRSRGRDPAIGDQAPQTLQHLEVEEVGHIDDEGLLRVESLDQLAARIFSFRWMSSGTFLI
ncbi:MAG: hypothetical protein AB7V42_13000 [Thermoleophilia bacterium]